MTSRPPALPAVVVKLQEELQKVADRLLRNAFKQAGDADERENFPTLAHTARALVGEERWRRSPNQAVIDVVHLAIIKLPVNLSDRSPEQTVGKNKWQGKPERHVAEIVYGYRDDEVPTRFDDSGAELPRSYDNSYLPAALSLLKIPKGSTWRRIFMVIKQDLAAELLRLTPDSLMAYGVTDLVQPEVPEAASIAKRIGDSRSLALSEPPVFVDRPEIRAQFAEAVRQRKRIIVLYGEGGTGKTWAAQEFTRELDSVVVRANRPELMHDDMAQALEDRGISCAGDDGSVRRSFRKMLSSDQAPAFVVLDDVQDERELRFYLPNDLLSRVVVTARTKIFSTPSHAFFVKVDSLSEEQAMCFLDSYLPNASRSEKLLLYRTLGGRVLAMRQACAYLTRYDVRIVDFVAALQHHRNGLLEQIPERTDVNLSYMYRDILSRVGESNPTAFSILKGISFTSPTVIRRLLDCYAAAKMEKPTAPAIRDSLLEGAYVALEELCIVERHHDVAIPVVSIHPLAQSILRHSFKKEAIPVCHELAIVAALEQRKVSVEYEREGIGDTYWYLGVPWHLEVQGYEVLRTCGMTSRREELLARIFPRLMNNMFGDFTRRVVPEWEMMVDPVQAIDFIRDSVELYPPNLRPYLKMRLEKVRGFQHQITAWREANGGKYPF
ncbi:AAA family ATPase [Streptomyces sp. NPDC090083]|uniref:AAA family ATPase n=1 Tax=Streptomyces sp. NPDC090083 TaxID=3365941 RepID=UPI00382FCC3F